jgi:hypothetical protein
MELLLGAYGPAKANARRHTLASQFICITKKVGSGITARVDLAVLDDEDDAEAVGAHVKDGADRAATQAAYDAAIRKATREETDTSRTVLRGMVANIDDFLAPAAPPDPLVGATVHIDVDVLDAGKVAVIGHAGAATFTASMSAPASSSASTGRGALAPRRCPISPAPSTRSTSTEPRLTYPPSPLSVRPGCLAGLSLSYPPGAALRRPGVKFSPSGVFPPRSAYNSGFQWLPAVSPRLPIYSFHSLPFYHFRFAWGGRTTTLRHRRQVSPRSSSERGLALCPVCPSTYPQELVY